MRLKHQFLPCSYFLSLTLSLSLSGAQSFVDLQFPNGQLTYVSGEGLSTSAFLPVGGGLLQVHGQYPGEMRFSFSCKVWKQIMCFQKYLILIWNEVIHDIKLVFLWKLRISSPMYYQNKWGTRITPMVQWPDKSFSLGLAQAMAWQRSGLMVRPTVQCR